MGYLFLCISLLAGLTKGFCGKKTGGCASTTKSAVLLSIFRMTLCTIIGFFCVFVYGHTTYLLLPPKLLIISAFSGIATSAFVVIWLILVRKSAYMLLDVFLMLGALVPMVTGFFLFGENISAYQWIGFLILVSAAVILYSYNNSIKLKLDIPSVFLLIMCGISSGLADFLQKAFVKSSVSAPISVFNLYTYIFAVITLILVYTLIPSEKQEDKIFPRHYVYIIIMSVALFVNSYFKTKAALYLDSAQLYPISYGATLILSALMAAVFFKEKLTVKCVLGLFTALIGLLVMNML